MIIPVIFGQPIHVWFGMVLFLMLILQVLIAKKLVPIPFKWHRRLGYLILISAFFHGLVGVGLNFGFFSIG
ncbi:MAG: hypothetical protein FD141_1506 [Fusobacteria bacterium]|nr:MAG: hypothetical protein FD141_1506 [Fusobacteriota bacterium]KAF0230219.1 MAG: hypothetical protein FD182_609 [Fusobacteriota bacterium]